MAGDSPGARTEITDTASPPSFSTSETWGTMVTRTVSRADTGVAAIKPPTPIDVIPGSPSPGYPIPPFSCCWVSR